MNDIKTLPDSERDIDKKAGHWVLAQLGKKVLRPGGKAMTQAMLSGLAIGEQDDVVEFAPGMGFTANLCLQKRPRSYTAIEQNEKAAQLVSQYLNGDRQICLVGNAQSTCLSAECATVVYGEAMLTMQSDTKKQAIVDEAARILRSGGRYGIHELCLVPNTLSDVQKRRIQKEISDTIKHPAKPLSVQEWCDLLEGAGFEVVVEHVAPMHLLEPRRMIDDEGVLGFLRIAKNLILKPDARKRVFGMRRIFRKHRDHLAAVTLVAKKKEQHHV
ncbi:methyltransferase domain-containing protein [Thaumasiovibrio subtropicus]|uniref:methyltransferase domain-containing protein n=1 Tax=Thaumasiovibrio subtropicus TaxID=1891207 RepID=UPI000B34F13E|nr:methyltransferase domain-containing protein [Thaumasiovibrio subtropicus]